MMELENGMVSGAMPYNQSDSPLNEMYTCPVCGREVQDDEYVYSYQDDEYVYSYQEWYCLDCLRKEAANMSPDELADFLQVSTEKARNLK